MKQMVSTSRKSISAKGMAWVGGVLGDSNGEELSGKEDVDVQPRRRSFFGITDGEVGIDSNTSTVLDGGHASKTSFTVGTRKENHKNKTFQITKTPHPSLPIESEDPAVTDRASEQRSSASSVAVAGEGGIVAGRRSASGRRKSGRPPQEVQHLHQASDPESNGQMSNVSDANTGVMESGGSEAGIIGKDVHTVRTMSSLGSQDGNASVRGSDPKPASGPNRKPGVAGKKCESGS
jgi:hypothetical protein